MMAVDSKSSSSNGVNGATNGQATSQVSGVSGTAGTAGKTRRKRPSQLQESASSLPTVEHSLEEFIAKANQTLVDVSTWGNAENQAKEEDEKRREVDALRWKAAEGQLREGEAREGSLRRQLDGLQGKLAEAEARAAVAGTTVGSAAHDTTISELKTRIEQAERDRRLFEEQKSALSQQLIAAKQDAAVARTSASSMQTGALGIATPVDEAEAEERVRIAEAKAAKAIAAARAAQAGLTVSSADLAAIESGLVIVDRPTRSTPWLAMFVTSLAVIAAAVVLTLYILNKDKTQPAQPAAAQPQPTQEAAPAKPIVTPIDETPTAVETSDKGPAAAVQPAAVEPAAAIEPAAKPAAIEPAAPTPAAQPTKSAKAKQSDDTPAKAPKTARVKAKTGIADPFDETPAKAPAPARAPKKPSKPAEKKPAGGIVDPF